MKVSDYIASRLADHGVPFVYEMSGGMITRMLDSIYQQGRIRIVSMHHEQGAAFAADATGRLTGIPGVAMATSGPGAINLLTGVGSCHFDSAPGVFITGQVNRNEMKGTRSIRQMGFQETDIVGMVGPITKAAWRVERPEDVPELLDRAFVTATEGRPGPVVLDVPMDVQGTEVELQAPPLPDPSLPAAEVDEATWDELWSAMSAAQRPLILVGGGVQAAHAASEARDLIRLTGVPVASSLLALDVLGYDDPLRAGMIGSYGNRWTNLAVGRSDFILVLGARLDVRQTGSDTAAFKDDREIFQVDCHELEINNRVQGCKPIVAHLRAFLDEAVPRAKERSWPERSEWLNEIAGLREQWPDTGELAGVAGINPNVFMHELSGPSREAAAFVVDVGQHQMWAGQSIEVREGQRFLTSGGMGSMGYALPAAVGAALVTSPAPVVVIAGDGGFQSNIQELETVVHNRLPLKIVVINNRSHGMVRQFQESYFESRYQSTVWGYSAPDFARVAEGYGIPARTISDPSDVPGGLKWLWSQPDEPVLLQVMVSMEANAYPKIAFGRPITEMEPFAKPTEVEGA